MGECLLNIGDQSSYITTVTTPDDDGDKFHEQNPRRARGRLCYIYPWNPTSRRPRAGGGCSFTNLIARVRDLPGDRDVHGMGKVTGGIPAEPNNHPMGAMLLPRSCYGGRRRSPESNPALQGTRLRRRRYWRGGGMIYPASRRSILSSKNTGLTFTWLSKVNPYLVL